MGLVLDTVTVEGNVDIGGNITKGGATITLPTSNDTIVLLTEAQTLTNKTISGASNTLSSIATTSFTGTLQAAQFPALTGHVTTTAGSLATTIGAGVVTNAMLAGSITFAKLVGTDITAVGTLTNLTVTNPISGSITGNAATATALQTARNINGVAFDGTAPITITAAAGTLTGTTLNSTVVNSSLTSVGTLTNLTVSNPINGSITGNAATATLASTVTTNANLTGPITSSGNATSVTANAITNAMLAQVATQTFKGRTTAATGNVEDLTASQATAMLDVFVGDSGSGGVKGLVPAPAATDAAANKFLKANGTWTTIVGGGTVTTVSVATANGVSGSVTNDSTTPEITLTLGAITPSSVAAFGTVTGSNLSGTNTGDQTITLSGDVSGSGTSGITVTLNTVAATKGGTGQTSYAVGDLLYASTTTALSKLADVATGNALISGGVSTAPSWGKIGLTTHVSGTLPVANGGTNSTTALNNGRIIVSSGGAIVEAAALTNGQILIGSTGAAPVAATLSNGYGINVANGAGTITPAVSLTTSQSNETTTLTTTSTTDTALSTSITGTPAAGTYLVIFSCTMGSNATSAARTTISLYTGASLGAAAQQTATERTVKNGSGGQGASVIGSVSFQTVVAFSGTDVYEIRWRVSGGTSSIFHRQLTLLRIA